jgi:DNA-binding XRE family transcriptional regulator
LVFSSINPVIALASAINPVWICNIDAIYWFNWTVAAATRPIENPVLYIIRGTLGICISLIFSSINPVIALASAINPVWICNIDAIYWFNWTVAAATRPIENPVLYVIRGTLGICISLVFSSINPVIALASAINPVWIRNIDAIYWFNWTIAAATRPIENPALSVF